MSKQNNPIPTWAKALITIGAIGAGIYVVYTAVVNIFTSGVSTYEKLYEQQWNALMQKMANYVKQNASSQTGFTPTQQASIKQEENILQQTQQGLTAAANGLTNSLMWTIIGVATAAVIGASAVAILKGYWASKNRAASTYGYTYSVVRVIADELSQMGYPLQSANIITTTQQMFQIVDQPIMAEQITSLQTSLATLTGAQLLAAQQMIALLQTDLAAIPSILSVPILTVPIV